MLSWAEMVASFGAVRGGWFGGVAGFVSVAVVGCDGVVEFVSVICDRYK